MNNHYIKGNTYTLKKNAIVPKGEARKNYNLFLKFDFIYCFLALKSIDEDYVLVTPIYKKPLPEERLFKINNGKFYVKYTSFKKLHKDCLSLHSTNNIELVNTVYEYYNNYKEARKTETKASQIVNRSRNYNDKYYKHRNRSVGVYGTSKWSVNHPFRG